MKQQLLEVSRSSPPAIGNCRGCDARIEWVRTQAGRAMPVDAPLVVEQRLEATGDRPVVLIDAAHCHFVTCPDAAQFSRRRQRATPSLRR